MYQVNFLSHQKLSLAMLPSLSIARPSARVVHVSSSMHLGGSLAPTSTAGEAGWESPYSADARNLEQGNRVSMSDGFQQRYADVKLMQVLYSKELNARLAAKARAGNNDLFDEDEEGEGEEGEGKSGRKQTVFSNSIHPGFVLTDLDRDMGLAGSFIKIFRRFAARPARDGAVTQVTVATAPELEGVGGRYFSDACMGDMCDPGLAMNAVVFNKEHAAANDARLREWLWETAAEITGEDLE